MTVVVKLGSSIVATDEGGLRGDVLDSICEQVSRLELDGERVVLVTSGAIALGTRLMGLGRRPKRMDELQAASAMGQGDLFFAYETRLLRNHVRAAQVLLTRSDIARRSNYGNALRTIERLIAWGVVPVINENDTTATQEITFGDNDFLAAQVAVFLRARLLVLLTNTDGLFTADPRRFPEVELIREVEDFERLREIDIGDYASTIGRGGMGSKVVAAEMACESEVPAVICNGATPNALLDAAKGKSVGTRFFPSGRRERKKPSVFKLWLKYAGEPTGTIWIDQGAAKRLRESGSSLLAVGVVGSEGDFDSGDVVRVATAARSEPIGHGMTEFSSVDLKEVAGMRSDAIQRLMPGAPREVINRDRFVLV